MTSEIEAMAKLARANVRKLKGEEKQAFLPPEQMAAPPDPMMGGAPPGGAPPGMDPAMMGGSVPQMPGMEQLPPAGPMPAEMGGAPPGPPPGPPPEGGGEATVEERLTNIEGMLETLMGALGMGAPPEMGQAVPTEEGGGPPMPEEVMPGGMGGMDPAMMGGGAPPGMPPMQVAASDKSPTAKMAAVMTFVNGLKKRA